MFKNLLYKIKLTLKLFFIGLRAGDDAIFGTDITSSDGDSMFEKQMGGGVFHDLIEHKVTQEVEEIRDKHYRVFKESDHFNTSTITMGVDENGNISGFKVPRLSKKPEWSFIKHVDVYNTNLPIVTIQDNRHYESSSKTNGGLYDYETTLEIKRDGITPRFEIEKFVKKMVVREPNDSEDKAFVDFYVATEASQFGKIDAIFISNIAQIFETKNFRSDILDFSEIQWVSYKAWGCDDICWFYFDKVSPVDINVFDGNFVLTFDCHIVKNGEYIPEKYRTKTLDNKYKVNAPKDSTFTVEY